MKAALRIIALAAFLPCLAMCQPDRPAADRAPANDTHAQGNAREAVPTKPVVPALPPLSSTMPPDVAARLAENDRIIADNQRMIGELQQYSRADQAKLDRLTEYCQKKMGDDMTGPGAKRIFNCVKASWSND